MKRVYVCTTLYIWQLHTCSNELKRLQDYEVATICTQCCAHSWLKMYCEQLMKNWSMALFFSIWVSCAQAKFHYRTEYCLWWPWASSVCLSSYVHALTIIHYSVHLQVFLWRSVPIIYLQQSVRWREHWARRHDTGRETHGVLCLRIENKLYRMLDTLKPQQ